MYDVFSSGMQVAVGGELFGLEAEFVACLEANDLYAIALRVTQVADSEDLDALLVYWKAAFTQGHDAAAALCAVWLGVIGGQEILEEMIAIFNE